MLRFHDMIRHISIYDALYMNISEPRGSNFIYWKNWLCKEYIGNTILWFYVFDNKVSAFSLRNRHSATKGQYLAKVRSWLTRLGSLIQILQKKKIFVEMTKWYTLVSPGTHAINLVVQVGRFTEEEQQTNG